MSSDVRPTRGHTFWLFGLSGAGKSTLAAELSARLSAQGLSVFSLDGDLLRAGLCRDLGFSAADRAENLRRAAEVARLVSLQGHHVVASFITPLEENRRAIESIVEPAHLSWVFVDAPLEVCAHRDVKGLYQRAKAGQVAMMTGIASGFEAPSRADLALTTGNESVAESARRLGAYAAHRLQIA